ncbi:MAG TPA: thiamine pyrophosphate-binding protein, partial [Burkholderiaceae bacterium]
MKSSSAEQTPRVAAVYQILAEDIKALGIDAVFGLISDDICQLVATLDGLGVRFYGVRHETNAIMMAEGYASTTGRLGIAMIGRGPAMANGMHGLMAAGKSGSRVLIIAGEAPLAGRAPNALGPDLKSFAAAQVVAAAGLPVFAATSVDVARSALADAVAEAELGKAVTLLLPMDVQVASVEVMPTRAGPLAPKAAKPSPSARAPSLAAAVELLSKSRRPLIIGGVGAHRAGARQAIEDLAARIGALLVTSLKAKDLFRGNPYDLGIIGSSSHSAARRYIEQADCVLVLGASLNYLTMVSG